MKNTTVDWIGKPQLRIEACDFWRPQWDRWQVIFSVLSWRFAKKSTKNVELLVKVLLPTHLTGKVFIFAMNERMGRTFLYALKSIYSWNDLVGQDVTIIKYYSTVGDIKAAHGKPSKRPFWKFRLVTKGRARHDG